MALSILHRMSGFGLGLGTLMLAWWLIAVALGPEAYQTFQAFGVHWLGRLVLFGFTWAMVLHLLSGIRHLFWDMGWGFDLAAARRSGWLVVIGSVAVTVVVWVLGYGLV